MKTKEKIFQIMTLAGVVPRDFERAAENYTSLSEAELDERLGKLLTAEAKIKAWRKNRRHVAAPSVQAGARPAAKTLPLQDKNPPDTAQRSHLAFRHHASNLVHLIERLQQWHPPLPESLAVEIASQVEKLANLKNRPPQPLAPTVSMATDADDSRTDNTREQDILAHVARHLVGQIEAAVKHPLLWSGGSKLAPFKTIEALARLENHILSYRPDAIVSVNKEGMAVARLVLHDLGLNIPLVSVHGAADSELVWDDQQNLHGSPKNVFVVGHIGWSGATMLKTITDVRSRYPTTAVMGAVLASSMEAVQLLHRSTAFLYHHLSAERHLELSVDVSKGVTITEHDYRLGTQSADADDMLIISRHSLRLARTEIAARYPGESPF